MAPSPRRRRLLFLAAVVATIAALPAAVVALAEHNMNDFEALMQLKKSFTNSSSLSSWLITDMDGGSKSPCAAGSHEWHGVVCSRGVVTRLRLNGLKLGGTIDVDALASFPRLRSVSFAGNNFSGPLPGFHQIKALKSMYLSNNQFSGAIPDDFFANLSHLKKLWLNGNQLSGPIPASISQATSLLELHLDRNAFTGELPPEPPPALKSFNVSGNDLEGVVPEAFRKFDAGRFAGNEYLCYAPTDAKPCRREQAVASWSRRLAVVVAAVLVSAVLLLVALRACSGNSGSQKPRRLDMVGLEEKPPVYMVKQASTTTQKRSTSWLGMRPGSSLGFGHRRAASAAKVDDLSSRSAGDLIMVNESKGVFRLTDLMKAAAEVIGSGGLRSAYKAVMASGVAVVVKRARDMNRATKDASPQCKKGGHAPSDTHFTNDFEALMQLKKSFTNSSSLSSWLITDMDGGSKSPCARGSHEWHGVVCSRGVVTRLRLNGLRLGGTIDVDALASFPRLRSVSFARNNFSGPLPGFHQIKALKSMYLSNNQFSGAIPDDFFANLSHLKKLWLNDNQLSGPIPASISHATSLLELHLDRNAFTGELPPEPPPALKSFNVSGNDLEGVVPEAFRKFDAGRFAGNEYLCYTPTDAKPCRREQAVASWSRRLAVVVSAVLVSAVLLLVALRACSSSSSQKPRRLDMAGLEEKPPVYMVKQASTTTQKRSTSWLGMRPGSSLGLGHRRAASAAKVDDLSSRSAGDLVMVNESKGVFGLTDLMKAAAEVIGSGGLGSAYKAVMASGVAVVVKRARDMNRATKDALLYVLHGDRGMDYAALDWPTRLKVAVGVARGVAFLHAELGGHEVPHGNLKSANILLAPDFEPLLVDFGFSGLMSHTQSPHPMLAYRAPECAAGHLVSAKADVYCLGIVLLELLTGKFPAQYLQNAKGGTDLVMWATSALADGFERDLFDPAIMAAWKFAVPDMTRLMRVAVDCVEVDLEKRPDMKVAAARVEEVVRTALATVRERREQTGGEGTSRPGDSASRSSHAAYVRDGSIQRVTSVGERSSRRGSSDYSYGISLWRDDASAAKIEHAANMSINTK
ncbi:hypothetical protein U9M48_029434, partial [Paspalum notatum var. saurae]